MCHSICLEEMEKVGTPFLGGTLEFYKIYYSRKSERKYMASLENNFFYRDNESNQIKCVQRRCYLGFTPCYLLSNFV